MPPSIPNEVVYKIFQNFVDDGNGHQLLFSLRWTKLLFVCRQWRDVGLSSCQLWSFVNFESSVPEFSNMSWKGPKNLLGPIINDKHLLASRLEADLRRLTMQLARARQHPLTVRIRAQFWVQQVVEDIERHPSLQTIQALQRSLFAEPRAIICLTLVGSFRRMADIMEELVLHPHPHLMTLDVRPALSGLGGVSVPESLLNQQASSLRDLKIMDTFCNWNLVHNMRSLAIGSHWTSHDIRIQTIIDVLHRSPNLEELEINRVHLHRDDTAADTIASNDEISLPRLSALTLAGHAHLGASLFLLIANIPANAQVCMSTIQEEQLGTHIHDLLQARVIKRLRHPDAPVIRTFAWDRNTNWLSASETTNLRQLDIEFPYWIVKPHVFLKLGIHPWEPPTAFQNFTKELPLGNATLLDMRPSQYCEAENTRMLFGLMPSLTTIAVSFSKRTAEEMLGVLEDCLREGGSGRRPAKHLIIAPGDQHKTNMGISRALRYCAEAKRAGVPLDALEVWTTTEDMGYGTKLLYGRRWSELYHDLAEGFVYNGVLYNEETGDAGRAWAGYASGV
ncbi:hypothetical protein PENSPDRAFT_269432 [Peniophora sp. CONT]|nr:hypothetical protein PENSPDRAFT_269432 [Peniophora sp. CONT]